MEEKVLPAVAQVAQDISLTGLIADADIVVKIVMLLLVLASVVCWTIIFNKYMVFRSLRFKTAKFEKMFSSLTSLEQVYTKTKRNIDNPMASLVIVGVRELQQGALKDVAKPSQQIKDSAKDSIFQSLHATKNRALARLEKDLIVLATVGSSAPFIGLFGTVWGIMNSFQSIAATKNTTLAVVAPGIAEALLATAIGLFAAIPAVIAFNILGNQIRVYAGRVEDFLGQLHAMISHEIELLHK